MVRMVEVGAIITRKSVCFPALYGVPVTHSAEILTFRPRWSKNHYVVEVR